MSQGAHLEQSTPYHALSELTAALIAIIVEPDARGCICKEDFAEAMPSEVRRTCLSDKSNLVIRIGTETIGIVPASMADTDVERPETRNICARENYLKK